MEEKVILDPSEIDRLLELIKSGKKLVDIGRELLVGSEFEIINKEVYQATIEQHNQSQETIANQSKNITQLKELLKNAEDAKNKLIEELKDTTATMSSMEDEMEAMTELYEQSKVTPNMTADVLKEIQKIPEDNRTVSAKVIIKIGDSQGLELGATEPLGDRNINDAHQELYLKLLTSSDNLLELGKR